jgi:hypothetical protein
MSSEELAAAMLQDYESMKSFDVFTEVSLSQLSEPERKGLISSRWVHRRKPDGAVRSRLFCRELNESVESRDDVYAATLTFSTFKLILAHALNSDF